MTDFGLPDPGRVFKLGQADPGFVFRLSQADPVIAYMCWSPQDEPGYDNLPTFSTFHNSL
jgi:hypothetical protein